jgi:hypothetical protein
MGHGAVDGKMKIEKRIRLAFEKKCKISIAETRTNPKARHTSELQIGPRIRNQIYS